MKHPGSVSLVVLAMYAASLVVLVAPLLLIGTIGGSDGGKNSHATGVVVSEFGAHVVPVDLQLDWSEPRQIPAPAWAGSLITRVDIRPGTRLSPGDSVLSIDGVVRVAMTAEEPPHRIIQSGDSGVDVEALRALLTNMKLGPVGKTDRFGWTDVVALRRLAEQLGVGGAQYVSAFDPAWVVWVGPNSHGVTVGRVNLLAGHPPPPAGETVFETPQRLLDVSVVPRDSEAALRTQQGVTYEIHLADATHQVDDFEIDASWVRKVITGGALPIGTESVSAIISATPDSTLPLVPASAIRISSDGSTCVIVIDHDTLKPTPVEIVGREITGVFVTGVSAGQQIVVGDAEQVDGCVSAGT